MRQGDNDSGPGGAQSPPLPTSLDKAAVTLSSEAASGVRESDKEGLSPTSGPE